MKVVNDLWTSENSYIGLLDDLLLTVDVDSGKHEEWILGDGSDEEYTDTMRRLHKFPQSNSDDHKNGTERLEKLRVMKILQHQRNASAIQWIIML